jgi:hypothetical protein
MNGLTRFVGYLGLVALLGGFLSLALLPNSRFLTEAQRNVRVGLQMAEVVGFGMILVRLVYLAAMAYEGRTRILVGVGLVVVLFIGAIAFVGITLLVTTGAA